MRTRALLSVLCGTVVIAAAAPVTVAPAPPAAGHGHAAHRRRDGRSSYAAASWATPAASPTTCAPSGRSSRPCNLNTRARPGLLGRCSSPRKGSSTSPRVDGLVSDARAHDMRLGAAVVRLVEEQHVVLRAGVGEARPGALPAGRDASGRASRSSRRSPTRTATPTRARSPRSCGTCAAGRRRRRRS